MKLGVGRWGLMVGFVLLAGCGRYGDFVLLDAGGAAGVGSYRFEALEKPVMGLGPAGTWDSVDVLNPSVVRRGGRYFNFYSGFDGSTWHTGLATSSDGVAWTREGRVFSPDQTGWEGSYIGANGCAVDHGGEFLYWYQAGPRETPLLGMARSRDGRAWTRHPSPVVRTGPRGSWDERGVADPYVIRVGASFYLYYLGQDRARRQRLGLARSSDGVRWEKLRSNPVLELGGPDAFDEVGLGEPAVWSARGWYWMLYTGRDRREHRRLGLARSRDGVAWHKLPEVFAGGQPWNSKVVCDPSVEAAGDVVRVWFGGGDAASPDENLHGQIGVGLLRPSGATLAK